MFVFLHFIDRCDWEADEEEPRPPKCWHTQMSVIKHLHCQIEVLFTDQFEVVLAAAKAHPRHTPYGGPPRADVHDNVLGQGFSWGQVPPGIHNLALGSFPRRSGWMCDTTTPRVAPLPS